MIVTVAERESELLIPVTVTVKVPAVDPEQDSVEVPEVTVLLSTTLVGFNEQVRPEGETEDDNVTVPAKPFWPDTVIVEVAEPPATKLIVVGLARRLKSRTLTVTVAVRVRSPLVPVTVTVNVAAVDPLTVRVEAPDPSTLVGLRDALKPSDETEAVSSTLPEKPPVPVIVIVDVPEEPAAMFNESGFATIEKSGVSPTTLKRSVNIWPGEYLVVPMNSASIRLRDTLYLAYPYVVLSTLAK